MENLKIDREFEMLIPALTLDEYEQLESNILSDGEIFNPIFTWNGYIIDGHHRYRAPGIEIQDCRKGVFIEI